MRNYVQIITVILCIECRLPVIRVDALKCRIHYFVNCNIIILCNVYRGIDKTKSVFYYLKNNYT